jgi:hypothetical protein
MSAHLVAWNSDPVDDPRALAMVLEDGLDEGAIVLLASDVVASERQIAAAAIAAKRRWERGSAVARSLGAEFMRCLAGSHHVGEAIRAVGLASKATSGWVVGLAVDLGEVEQRMESAGLQSVDAHPMTANGRSRLGLPSEGDAELLSIGLIAESDLLA